MLIVDISDGKMFVQTRSMNGKHPAVVGSLPFSHTKS